jgi:hypothetical protein
LQLQKIYEKKADTMKSSHSRSSAEKDRLPIPLFMEAADGEVCACANHVKHPPLLWWFSACPPSSFLQHRDFKQANKDHSIIFFFPGDRPDCVSIPVVLKD